MKGLLTALVACAGSLRALLSPPRMPWHELKKYLWHCTPIRCIRCRRWFCHGDFWNPWGPRNGPGLACSVRCCWEANPGEYQTLEDFEASFP